MSSKNYFSKSREADMSGRPAGALVGYLQGLQKGRAGSTVDSQIAAKAISMEGMNESHASILSDQISSFRSSVISGLQANGVTKLTVAQEHAIDISVVAAGNPLAYAGTARSMETLKQVVGGSANNVPTVVVPAENDLGRVSLEAFENVDRDKIQTYTTAFNTLAAQQGPAMEVWFPTVTVGPMDLGFEVNIKQVLAYSEVTRQASGALDAFNRRNLVRALIDSSILAVEQTRLIPVFRASGAGQNDDKFVAGIAATTYTPPEGGAPFSTKPLAMGVKFSLPGLCQTDATLAAGNFDQTDAVDSSIRLAAIYLSVQAADAQDSNTVKTEYFKIDTLNMPSSDFTSAAQLNTQRMDLKFKTTAVKLTAATKTVAGAASALLDALTTNSVFLDITVTGDVTRDTGDTVVSASPVTIANVFDANGVSVKGQSAGNTAAALLSNVTVVGYDLLAYRTNSNKRSRGKLLDRQSFRFLFTVPLLPPMTILRPLSGPDTSDSEMISDLVYAVRSQADNAGITTIVKTRELLQAYASNANSVMISANPTLFGPAALMVNPAYRDKAIDCATALDSLTTENRATDLAHLLYNSIRDMAARLFVDSGLGPALMASYEGKMPKVTVLVLTDPLIHRYMNIVGDTRLFGDQFDYKLCETYNQDVTGKIFISFGLADAMGSGVPNPLHFGNMAFRPELTYMLPMPRNGGMSQELTVQPSYRHVVHLPVMGYLTVSGIETVMNDKVAIENRPVS